MITCTWSRRRTSYWSHYRELQQNMRSHLNDLDAAELSLQQHDISFKQGEHIYRFQQLEQLLENNHEFNITESHNESGSGNVQSVGEDEIEILCNQPPYNSCDETDEGQDVNSCEQEDVTIREGLRKWGHYLSDTFDRFRGPLKVVKD